MLNLLGKGCECDVCREMAAKVLFRFLVRNNTLWHKAAVTELLDHHHFLSYTMSQHTHYQWYQMVWDRLGLSKQFLMYWRTEDFSNP